MLPVAVSDAWIETTPAKVVLFSKVAPYDFPGAAPPRTLGTAAVLDLATRSWSTEVFAPPSADPTTVSLCPVRLAAAPVRRCVPRRPVGCGVGDGAARSARRRERCVGAGERGPAARGVPAPAADRSFVVVDPTTGRSTMDWGAVWDEYATLNSARMAFEVSRVIPGYGALGGIAADALNLYSDLSSIPNPSESKVTTGAIVLRDILNMVNNAIGHLLFLDQAVQDGLAVSVVGAPFVGFTATVNEVLSATKIYIDMGMIFTDTAIMAMAAYNQSKAAPGSPEADAWQGITDGFMANILGDGVGLVFDALSMASGGAAQTEIARTGLKPIAAIMAQSGNIKGAVISIVQSVWNVYGGGAVGGARSPSGGGSAPAPAASPSAAPVARISATDAPGIDDVAAAAEATFYTAVAQELLAVKGCYTTGDMLLGLAGDMFAEKVAEMRAAATVMLDGQDPVRVIHDTGMRALAEMRTSISQMQSIKGWSLDAHGKAELLRAECDSLTAKVNALTLPHPQIPQANLGDNAAANAAESVVNLAGSAANSGIEAMINTAQRSLDEVKPQLTGPIASAKGEADNAAEFLHFVTVAADVMINATTQKIAHFEERLGQCNTAEDMINMVVQEVLAEVGISTDISVEDVRKAWHDLGPMIDDAQVEATRRAAAARARIGRGGGGGADTPAPADEPPPDPAGAPGVPPAAN